MKWHAPIVALLLLAVVTGCGDDATGPENSAGLWQSSTPQAQGIDPLVLDSAFIQASAAGFVDGLLVVRNGYLVAERYYNGYDRTRPHNVMSVSKSFLSAIVGLALERGYLDSLEERVLDYFPEYVYPGMDSAKYAITIRHLLTMRMGIRGEADNDYAEYWRLHSSPDWIKATIETPLPYLPGERMVYNTFQTHLLSGIITKATGESTLDFAHEALLSRMKITVDQWEQDPQGYYFGGNSMYFSPQEMAVLGWLYLHGGRIDGQQIVPSDWVSMTLSPSTNLIQPNAWGELKNYNYAWLWWVGEIGGHATFLAYGYGGQFVVSFPDLQMVVVSTARWDVDPDMSTVQEWAILALIANYIVRSAEG